MKRILINIVLLASIATLIAIPIVLIRKAKAAIKQSGIEIQLQVSYDGVHWFAMKGFQIPISTNETMTKITIEDWQLIRLQAISSPVLVTNVVYEINSRD